MCVNNQLARQSTIQIFQINKCVEHMRQILIYFVQISEELLLFYEAPRRLTSVAVYTLLSYYRFWNPQSFHRTHPFETNARSGVKLRNYPYILIFTVV